MPSRRTALSSMLAAAVAAPRAQAEAVTILRVQRRVIEDKTAAAYQRGDLLALRPG